MLEGAFTILATDCRQPDIVVGARHDSPLVVGLGEGENFLGSDVAAFVAYTKRAMEVDQDQAVCVSADKVIVADFNGNARIKQRLRKHAPHMPLIVRYHAACNRCNFHL